jgi:hypothetical protein
MGITVLFGGALFSQSTITCSSEDGKRHYCDTGSRDSRAYMVNQRSGSKCLEGYSWGSESGRVWVDHGCRADFAIRDAGRYRDEDYRGSGRDFGRNTGSNEGGTITCSSEDGKRHYCDTGSRDSRAFLVKQRSGSRCEEGYSWGSERGRIWVDHGCRADFAFRFSGSGGGRGGDYNDHDRDSDRNGGNREATITCSSDDGQRHYCDLGSRNARAFLVNQRSGSACQEGYSWGSGGGRVWVDHGCRADFGIRR